MYNITAVHFIISKMFVKICNNDPFKVICRKFDFEKNLKIACQIYIEIGDIDLATMPPKLRREIK